jgi:hypothetical protein
MNEDDEFYRELEAIFADRKKRMFPAQVLSRGGQLLATGQAVLASDGPAGVFWPQDQLREDKNLARSTILRKLPEQDVRIRSFALCSCPALFGFHYHFEVAA